MHQDAAVALLAPGSGGGDDGLLDVVQLGEEGRGSFLLELRCIGGLCPGVSEVNVDTHQCRKTSQGIDTDVRQLGVVLPGHRRVFPAVVPFQLDAVIDQLQVEGVAVDGDLAKQDTIRPVASHRLSPVVLFKDRHGEALVLDNFWKDLGNGVAEFLEFRDVLHTLERVLRWVLPLRIRT